MQEIDFLPQRYREATAQRSRKAWGGLVVLIYAGLLCTSGYLQKSGQKKLKEEVAAANQQRAMVTGQAARLSALEIELKRAETHADLIAYLRHPWPRTQIVAAVIEPLIAGISLSELRVQRLELSPGSIRSPVAQPRAASPAEGKSDDRSPAQRDLEHLHETNDGSAVAVIVKGSADDVSLVHIYLGHLGKDPLFARVDLMNIDGQQTQQTESGACRFTARLVVRQGYGQPNGPTTPLPAMARVNAREDRP